MSHHLIVDDSETNRKVLAAYFRKFKLSYDTARNGRECIDMVKENPDKYVCIWIDLRMPLMNGYDATKELRETLKYKRYIIGVSGAIEEESIALCREVKMNKLLSKPINFRKLEIVINKLFKEES